MAKWKIFRIVSIFLAIFSGLLFFANSSILNAILIALGVWLYLHSSRKLHSLDPTFSPPSFTDFATSVPAFGMYGSVVGMLIGLMISINWFANEPHAAALGILSLLIIVMFVTIGAIAGLVLGLIVGISVRSKKKSTKL